MKILSIVPFLAVLAGACGGTDRPEPVVRDTIAIRYVAEPETAVHDSASESSPVRSTFGIGESVSVLEDRGEWSEIRIGLDESGWVRRDRLAAEAPEDAMASGSPVPRFIVAPNAVFTPGSISGEIVLEASVNVAGEVFDVRTLRNTTGRPDLEAKNKDELRRAKFYPLVVDGRARHFIYEHRVTY